MGVAEVVAVANGTATAEVDVVKESVAETTAEETLMIATIVADTVARIVMTTDSVVTTETCAWTAKMSVSWSARADVASLPVPARPDSPPPT